MKTNIKNTFILLFCSFTAIYGQIKNSISEKVKIYGNCEMCKKTIETAGTKKKIATVEWDKTTKYATINYDAKKTNRDEILKRIALSGYDSDTFLAPDEAYAKLPECCQYSRVNKAVAMIKSNEKEMQSHSETIVSLENIIENDPLKPVFSAYFLLKDALVKTDASTASAKAKDLSAGISQVKMEKLDHEAHMVWMKVMKELAADAQKIHEAKDIEKQREFFMGLTKNIYALIKVSKLENPVYYQYCPMANDGKGANWLSKEIAVKNPYYGSMMLSCGEVVETLK